ncbi:PaaI family thioesterase [Umezawaea beigongshangensis]|uniref:PaaI family thioesterase n=1 Tax=Umezawaea beigongshangensis TaxID=2780383 RepID=UPI0018F1E22E|nr:PaaI family thioesterase [Umezawaea beigongshangensis]
MTARPADDPPGRELSADTIPLLDSAGFRCFACSPRHEHGLRLRMWHLPGTLTSITRFDADFASYPGVVHGGVIATVADELMANLVLVEHERLTFTTALRVRYLRPVEVGATCRIVARITSAGETTVSAEADVLAEDGATNALATASYQPIRPAQARAAFTLGPDDHDRVRPFLADTRPA